MTTAFMFAEIGLCSSLMSLHVLVRAAGADFRPREVVRSGQRRGSADWSAVAYAVAVLFLEPFYVAAGFGMYLNRRAELEAWDIEQEFRRAFAA